MYIHSAISLVLGVICMYTAWEAKTNELES